MRDFEMSGPRSLRSARIRRVALSGISVGLLLAGLVASPAAAARNVYVGCGSARVDKLIAAVRAANRRADSVLTVITLAPNCTYTLTHASSFPAYGPNGLPVITKRVEVHGRGATITRAVSAPPFRILAIGVNGRLTLDGLTVSNGHARDGANGSDVTNCCGGLGGDGRDGGGIYNRGRLFLEQVTVTGNAAGNGGDGGDSTSSDGQDGDPNLAGAGEAGDDTVDTIGGRGGAGGDGGGIYNEGRLVIIDSDISFNSAGHGGRGGNATSGDAGDGGDGSSSGGNGGRGGDATGGTGGDGGHGGAIFTIGTLFVSNGTFDTNAAGDGSDAGSALGGDGGRGGDPQGNGGLGGSADTTGGDGGQGSAIAVLGGAASVDDSTFTNNIGSNGGDALVSTGGNGGDGGCDGNGGNGGNGSATGGNGGSSALFSNGGSLSTSNNTVIAGPAGSGGNASSTGGNGGNGGVPC
jgi:hypothetical protein